MKKIISNIMIILLGLLAAIILSVSASAQGSGQIVVVKHMCGDMDMNQFNAMSHADKLNACPLISNTSNFDLLVQGGSGPQMRLSDAVAGNGQFTFNNVSFGNVTIVESATPASTHFGAVVMTPGARDQAALISASNGVVQLDTTKDPDDNNFTVHIFNFNNAKPSPVIQIFDNIFGVSSNSSATLSIKPPYPKGNDYVFVCNVQGFTPSSYTWFYGDGSKLVNIPNSNTFHTYTTPGSYGVSCTGTDATHTATGTLTVNVGSGTTNGTNTGFCASGLTCDGVTVTNNGACRTLSCGQLCTGDFCISNVTNMQVCPAVQNTAFNNTQTTNTTNLASCTLADIPAVCNGGTVTSDTNLATFDNCRHVTCSNGGNTLTVQACEKPNEINPTSFELSTQGRTGSGLQLCIGDACVGDNNGFAIGTNFACTTNVTSNFTTNVTTNTTTNLTNVTTNTTTNTTNTTANVTLSAILSGANEVPPVASNGTGNATATIVGNTLTLNGTFMNLTSAATAVDVLNAPAGSTGPRLFTTPVVTDVNGTSGNFSLTQTLTNDQISGFENGSYYIDVDSNNFPTGEIRGQLT